MFEKIIIFKTNSLNIYTIHVYKLLKTSEHLEKIYKNLQSFVENLSFNCGL